MTKKKIDAVIEAVHYESGSQLVAWVRLYERRGPTFSDVIIIERSELIRRIKAGKKIAAGTRQAFLSSTFNVRSPIGVRQVEGKDYLTVSDQTSAGDHLVGLPVI